MTENTIKGPAWISTFLATLAETGKVGEAVKAAGVLKNAVYFQRKTNRRFAEAWQDALGPKQAHRVDEAAPISPARNIGWRTLFFDALVETSDLAEAAKRAGVPLRTVNKARREDPVFATKWLTALHEGYDYLEMELLGYLRNPAPTRKMDVTAVLRLLAAHRETVERRRALEDEEDEQAVLESIDRFIDEMRVRRAANAAILTETEQGDGAE